MAEKKHKIGDQVQLNSGGPYMTVKDYNEEKYTEKERMVDTDWFDQNDNPHKGTYHEDQLKKVSNTTDISSLGIGLG